MVIIYDRPVTPREAEGRVQTAELLKWLQYSKYIPSTTESRLLQLGLDELFARTIDMTTLSVAFSIRLWTGWMRMPLRRRWAFPVYAGLVVADRRRTMNVMKFDSTYATLVAISHLDSPMGREAKRLIDKSHPRLEAMKEENPKLARHVDERVQRYLRQIFFWYAAFGPTTGAVISHLCLWNTLHDTFAGSTFLHTFRHHKKTSSRAKEFTSPPPVVTRNSQANDQQQRKDRSGDDNDDVDNEDDDSSARDIQQQLVLEAVEKKRRLEQQQQKQKTFRGTSSVDHDEVEDDAEAKKKQKTAATTPSMMTMIPSFESTTTVWVKLRLNFRWYQWEAIEISTAASDEVGGTVAFGFSVPLADERNDFVANELRKAGSSATLNWWYPARLWWTLRWLDVSTNPPQPPVPVD